MNVNNERSAGRISVVIPAFNEAKYLGPLQKSLRRQTQLLQRRHPEVAVNVFISDNGSTDATAEMARAFSTLVTGSVPQSRGSARRVGFEAAIEQNTVEAASHVIVSLDADTEIADDNYLPSTYEAFAHDQDLSVSHGPYWLKLTNGRIIKPPETLIRLVHRKNLQSGFKRFVRAKEDFLKPPYDEVFPGFNFAVREDAYRATDGFTDDPSIAEDNWLSYQLKKTQDASQILFNKNQLVITSGRAYETPTGRLSYGRVSAALFGHYASFGVELPQTSGDSLSTQALGAFIETTERQAYGLSEHQTVQRIVTEQELAELNRQSIEEARPAINHTTGEMIPGRYALIANK